ncbi:DNA primase regulatory subunit PriL [Methanococcoides methylutens]|uniref:DNA primase regulatory subunit PriL n=1 Tax=Methanococcoides methylutens TaxID=2226 RepID=UPI004043B24F
MENRDLALYPFVSEASEYVKGQGISVESLISSRAFESARTRGKMRVLQSLELDIEKPLPPNSERGKILTELLSYPFARIVVSCIDDSFLIRRYALAEAEAAYNLLTTEEAEFIQEFCIDFNITADIYKNPKNQDKLFDLHFTDYIKLASSLREKEWKLVNRRMDSGYVRITKKDLSRLLQEAIRIRIQNSLPIEVPDEICEECIPYSNEIKKIVEDKKSEFGIGELQEVDSELFPPCITQAIANVRAGVNLAHSMRFALTSFLLKIGMSVDEVVAMFNISPDFDDEKTRYQIEHIAGSSGTTYIPPSCDTMRTYGNCNKPDRMCEYTKNPLNYYYNKRRYKNKMENENENKA